MNTIIRTTLALTALVAGAAQAVPYPLPSGPEILQAKLSGPLPSYAVVCDSSTGAPCDVSPGRYQMQTFDLLWRGTRVEVSVGVQPSPTALPRITYATERRTVQTSDAISGVARVTAACPANAFVMSVACDAHEANFFTGDEILGGRGIPTSSAISAEDQSGSCRAIPASITGDDVGARVTATVACFSQ